VKVGDLVKRRQSIYKDDKYLNSRVGIIVEYDKILARVKWANVDIAKWINPVNIEVISESR